MHQSAAGEEIQNKVCNYRWKSDSYSLTECETKIPNDYSDSSSCIMSTNRNSISKSNALFANFGSIANNLDHAISIVKLLASPNNNLPKNMCN